MKNPDTSRLEDLAKIKSILGDDPKMAKTSLEILDKVRQMGKPDLMGWEYIEWSKKFSGYAQRAFLSGIKGSLSKRISSQKRKGKLMESPQKKLFHPEAYETEQSTEEEDLVVMLDFSYLRDYFLQQRVDDKLANLANELSEDGI